MSTIKSSAENLTLNADGSGNDIIFQSNGSNVATLDQAGLLTATTFAGSGASLTGLTSSQMPAGSVLQVVNATTSTQTANSTTTYADTTLTATITPISTSSKILVIVAQNGGWNSGGNGTNSIGIQLLRGATSINVFGLYTGYTATTLQLQFATMATTYLDSPATTSATTYKTQFKNMVAAASVAVQQNSPVSTITLMEIGV